MKPMYYIYHIKNRKIGVTIHPTQRPKSQLKPGETFEIIHQTEDIKMVSLLEQTLQMMYGYRVDACPYYKHPNYIRDEEHKNKMSTAKTGTVTSEETKLKLSKLSAGEKNPMFGKQHSDQALTKMRKPRQNVQYTECYCGRKISNSNLKRHQITCKEHKCD